MGIGKNVATFGKSVKFLCIFRGCYVQVSALTLHRMEFRRMGIIFMSLQFLPTRAGVMKAVSKR